MRSNTWMTPAAAILIAAVGSTAALAQPPASSAPRQTTPAAPGQVDLRPKFKTGQQTRYSFDQTAKNTIKTDDPDDAAAQEQLQTEHITLLLKVVESGDAGSTIQVVYESIKVRLMTDDGPAEYDSTKPAAKKPAPAQAPAPSPSRTPSRPGTPATTPTTTPAKPAPNLDPLKQIADMDASGMLAQMVGPMVGATITVKTDNSGAITSVSGGESLGGALPGLGGMGGSLVPSPTAVANWLVAGLGGPGNKGVAHVGETWTNKDALSGTPVGSFNMNTKHTLKSASNGTANLSFVGGIEPASQGTTPGGLAQVQSAAYTGTYAWDTRAGSLVEMNTDMRVVLEGGLMGAKSRLSSQTQVKVRRQ